MVDNLDPLDLLGQPDLPVIRALADQLGDQAHPEPVFQDRRDSRVLLDSKDHQDPQEIRALKVLKERLDRLDLKVRKERLDRLEV